MFGNNATNYESVWITVSIPLQKVKKSAEKKPAEKKPGKAAGPTPKRWPPSKDVKADVEFIFQSGLDAGQEMTMGKIYAELGKGFHHYHRLSHWYLLKVYPFQLWLLPSPSFHLLQAILKEVNNTGRPAFV